jgi:ubiquinone/menaquinone biosynthesis C-methylase UbiE
MTNSTADKRERLFINSATSTFWSYPIFDYASLYRMKLMREFLGDVTGKKAIDIGCGNGSISLLLWLLGAEVHSMDTSFRALEVTRSLRNLNKYTTHFDPNLCHSDAMQLPYEDEAFDIVCCLEALEFVQNDIPAISEIERVTKQGGLVILFIPYDPRVTGNEKHLGYYRRYSFSTIKQKLGSKQLRIERIDFWYFPMLKLFDLVRLRYIFAALGLLIEAVTDKNTPSKKGGLRNKTTFIRAFMRFYSTKFWRKGALPFLVRLFEINKMFKNAPYSYVRSRAQANDVFVILRKTTRKS